MIKLNRIIDPTTFPSDFTGVKRVELELNLLKQKRELRRGAIEKFDFDSKKWKKTKNILKLESYGKCAYCESNFTTVAYGDVEHFRPKSKYWWLAYCYHNYTASCQLCNQKYKGSKFPVAKNSFKAPRVRRNNTDRYLNTVAGTFSVDPIDSTQGISLSAYITKHIDERPDALDPYIDDPMDFIKYSANERLKEVLIIPKDGGQAKLVRSCVKLFGLNRKELRVMRYKKLFLFSDLKRMIPHLLDDNHKKALKKTIDRLFLNPSNQYSGMCNYFNSLPLSKLPTLI